MKKFSALTFLCAAVIGTASCSRDLPVDACLADKPPKDSRKVETHAMDFVLYPAYIPDGYTGCGKAWSEDGYLLLLIKFTDGIVRYVEMHNPDNEKNGVTKCEMNAQKKLVSGPAEQCSGFENYPMWREPGR